MLIRISRMAAGFVAAAMLSVTAYAGELVINYDGSDPAPKEAFEMVIKKFEEANPDITVKWNIFDHEGYKTSIRNFLTADAPPSAAITNLDVNLFCFPPAFIFTKHFPSLCSTPSTLTPSCISTPQSDTFWTIQKSRSLLQPLGVGHLISFEVVPGI